MNKVTTLHSLLVHLKSNADETLLIKEEEIIFASEKINTNNSGLTIKILSIVGGFLATLAFMGFLFISGLVSSGPSLIFFGCIFIARAIWADKKYNQILIDTICISLYVAGFCTIGFGLSDMGMNDKIVLIIFMLIAFAAMRFSDNLILAFISVLIINVSFLGLLTSNNTGDLIHFYNLLITFLFIYIATKEAEIINKRGKLSKLYNPTRTALMFSLLAGLFLTNFSNRGIFILRPDFFWISTLTDIVALLYITSIILQLLKVNQTKDKIIIYALTCILLLATVSTPGISGSILILLISFLINHKVGIVTGILSLLYFICSFYYDLGISLLSKSIILISTGILFMLFFLYINKKIPADEKI